MSSACSLYAAFLFTLAAPVHPELQEEKIYTVSEVHTKPQPVNGLDHFQTRWSRIGKYPQEALEEQVEGVVFIEFLVKADGTIHNAAVKTGIGYGCDEAALKAFNTVAREPWKPGLRKNQPVSVKMVLPYFFRIVKRQR